MSGDGDLGGNWGVYFKGGEEKKKTNKQFSRNWGGGKRGGEGR